MRSNCEFLWRKVEKILPESSVKFGKWLAGAATVATPVSGMDAEIFRLILEALRERCVLELIYKSPYKNREEREHVLAPWGVFFREHAWYLLAGKSREQVPYLFRLSRIIRAEKRPDLKYIEPPENYSQEKFTSSAWYVTPGDLAYKIKLRIFEPMATIVSETRWNPTQEITRLDSNTIELSAEVPYLKELARWIMSSAPYVSVIEPLELRNIVYDLAQKMMTLNAPE